MHVADASRLLGTAILLCLLGLLVTLQPQLLLVAVAAGFAVVALEAPVTAVGLVLLMHIATPVYMKAPVPGGLYSPPLSTALLLALIGTGVLAYLARSPLPLPPSRGGRRVISAFFVFCAVLAASLVNARTGVKGLETWISIFVFPGATIAVILCACRGVADVRRLSMFVIAGGVAACLYAVAEFGLGRNPLLETFLSENEVDYFSRDELGSFVYRSFSVYGNPLQFGMVMGMIFPFAAVGMSSAERPLERLALASASALLALGVVLTFSRGPLLALVTGSIVLAVICPRFRPWFAGGTLAAAAVLVFAWPSVGTGIADRIGDVDNMTLRLKLWQTAYAIFQENPKLGVGIGNFSQYYLDTIRDNHIGPFHEFGPDRITEIKVAENTYLQLAAETGVIGVVAGLSVILAMLVLCVSVGRAARDSRARALAIAITVSALVYLINGLFVTAYTFYFGTLLFIGFLPGCLLVLDRDGVTPNGPEGRDAWLGARV